MIQCQSKRLCYVRFRRSIHRCSALDFFPCAAQRPCRESCKRSIAYIGSAGCSSKVSQTSKIAALSTLYICTTYALSGAGSGAGVAAGNREGRDNDHPRLQVQNLRGLPLRLHSAHCNMMEKFPSFALTAALAQAMAPGDHTLINLLGLHVIMKVFV